jgi:hypothetical protein
MLLRLLALLMILGFVFAPAVVLAEEEKEPTYKGIVTSTEKNVLHFTTKDGKDHACTVADKAKITCDEKECKLADLKKGTRVQVFLTGSGKDAKATTIKAATPKPKK